MFYILNETKQIIAADDALLKLCGVSHIDELSSQIIKGETLFRPLSDKKILLKTTLKEETFDGAKTVLSSMLGHLTLVSLSHQDKKTNIQAKPTDELKLNTPKEEDNDSIDAILPEETLNIPMETDSVETSKHTEKIAILDNSTEKDSIALEDHQASTDSTTKPKETSRTNDSESLNLTVKENPEESEDKIDFHKETTKETVHSDKIELFDLNLEQKDQKYDDKKHISATPSIEIKNESSTLDLDRDDSLSKKEKYDTSEILINIHDISQKIGITADDYNHFLNDFIDTALTVEKDLQSTNKETKTEAIGTLSHLSDVLHLPHIGEILENIVTADHEKQRSLVESFYSTLSRITIHTPDEKSLNTKESLIVKTPEEVETKEEETLALFDTPKAIQETASKEDSESEKEMH